MKFSAIGLAVFVASFFLAFMTKTLQSVNLATFDDGSLPKLNAPQGGDPNPFVISATLYPNTSTSLIYTNTDGVIAELIFPQYTTDITRTIYFVTVTDTYAPGMLFSGYAFGLIPFRDGAIDKQYEFLQPVSLTVKYPDSIIPLSLSETQLGIYHPTGEQWIPAGNTCEPSMVFYQNLEQNLFIGSICNLAYYAIFGSHHHYLPIVAQH